jgi:hypothetical protein
MRPAKPEAAQVELNVNDQHGMLVLAEEEKNMDPITTSVIVSGLVQQAGFALFDGAKEYLLQRLGPSASPSETPRVAPLLDEYLEGVRADLQRVEQKLDEERIAKLYGALSQLRDASKSNAMTRQGLLDGALNKFHDIVQIPQRGKTDRRSNAELRSMAYMGCRHDFPLKSPLRRQRALGAVSSTQAALLLGSRGSTHADHFRS